MSLFSWFSCFSCFSFFLFFRLYCFSFFLFPRPLSAWLPFPSPAFLFLLLPASLPLIEITLLVDGGRCNSGWGTLVIHKKPPFSAFGCASPQPVLCRCSTAAFFFFSAASCPSFVLLLPDFSVLVLVLLLLCLLILLSLLSLPFPSPRLKGG